METNDMSQTENQCKQTITQYAHGMIFCEAFPDGIPVTTQVKDYFVKYSSTPVGKTYVLTVDTNDETDDAVCTFMKGTELAQKTIAKQDDEDEPAPSAEKPTVKSEIMKGVKFSIELQGKTYVTQAGLENETHKLADSLEGQTVHSSVVLTKLSEPGKHYTVKATVAIVKDGEVLRSAEAHGYSDLNNTGLQVQKHLLHMAETRAYNRAMRHLTNINVTSMEELDKLE